MSNKKKSNSSTSSDDSINGVITQEDAVYLAKIAISLDAELIDYEICPYSEEKMGFTGSHLKLTLKSRKVEESKNEDRLFFVKTMPVDVMAQADCVTENGTFLKETEFFRELVPLMMKNYKGEAWAPECYLVKGRHTLVFEDMSPKGFSNGPKFLEEHCVMSTVACVARLHACSLLAEELLNGRSLIELYPNIFEESEYRRTGRNYQWFTAGVDYLIVLAEEMGLDSSRLSEVCNRVFDVCVPSRTKRNVLSHGDLWSNNIMFDKKKRCRLIDFQLMRYAPLAHDLMIFLYLCTLREFREEKEADVIDYYYKTLRETLESSGYKGQVPSFDELKQGVEEQRLPSLVMAAVGFPFILIEAKHITEIMNNPKMYEEYFFKSRSPIIDKIMAQDQVFEMRVKEITRELVEKSLRFNDFPELT